LADLFILKKEGGEGMDNYLILAKRKASCPDGRPEACLCQVRASSEQEAVRNACRLIKKEIDEFTRENFDFFHLDPDEDCLLYIDMGDKVFCNF
jgi:hypothetical protein